MAKGKSKDTVSKGKPDSSSRTLDIGVRSAGLATFVFIGKFISIIFGAAMLIILARVLGPSNYGMYVVALATAGFIGAFGSINIGAYFNKRLPELVYSRKLNLAGTLIGDAVVFVLLISVVLTAAGVLLSGYLSSSLFGSSTYFYYIIIAVAGIFWIILYPILNTALVGIGNGIEIAISTMASLISQSIVSITLVLLGFGAIGAIGGYLSGFAIAALLTLYYINRHIPVSFSSFEFIKRLRGMLAFSVPLTLSGILGTLSSNFSVMFMGILLISSGVIGQYGVSMKVGNVIDVASGAIGVVLVPMFATAIYHKQSMEKIGKLYHSTLYYGLLFAAPMIVYASALSYDIIVTVFTQSYNLAVTYMPLVSIGILISLIGGYASAVLIGFGKVRKILRFSIYTVAAQFVAMIALGVLFRVIGIIIGYFFIGSIVSAFLYMRELRNFGLKIKIGPFARLALSNILLAIVLFVISNVRIRPLYLLAIGIFASFLVYPAALAATGAVSKDDLKILGKVGNEIPVVGRMLQLTIAYAKMFLRRESAS